jgi:hypothetical protein
MVPRNRREATGWWGARALLFERLAGWPHIDWLRSGVRALWRGGTMLTGSLPRFFNIVLKAAAAAAGVGPSAVAFSARLSPFTVHRSQFTVHSFLISYQLRPVTKF